MQPMAKRWPRLEDHELPKLKCGIRRRRYSNSSSESPEKASRDYKGRVCTHRRRSTVMSTSRKFSPWPSRVAGREPPCRRSSGHKMPMADRLHRTDCRCLSNAVCLFCHLELFRRNEWIGPGKNCKAVPRATIFPAYTGQRVGIHGGLWSCRESHFFHSWSFKRDMEAFFRSLSCTSTFSGKSPGHCDIARLNSAAVMECFGVCSCTGM